MDSDGARVVRVDFVHQLLQVLSFDVFRGAQRVDQHLGVNAFSIVVEELRIRGFEVVNKILFVSVVDRACQKFTLVYLIVLFLSNIDSCDDCLRFLLIKLLA